MNIINPYIHGGDEVAFDGFGNASRSFDGVSDYIDLGDSNDFSFGDGSNDSPFSISTWVKLNDITGTNKTLVGKYNLVGTAAEYLLFFHSSSNEFRFSLYDDSAVAWIRIRSSLSIVADRWYHVCVTYDGSQAKTGLKIYVDGSLQTGVKDSNNTYLSMENSVAPLTLGVYNSSNYLEGDLADARIYDTDLSSTDIANLYNGTNLTTNLVGHWLKDTPSLLDHAGNNDGTNYGSSWSPDNPSPAVEFGDASRSFDGVSDYVDLGNSTEFSFSDGNNDEPFSLSTWVNIRDNSTFRILSKDNGTGSSREWLLATDSGGNLNIYFIDNGQFRGREYTTPLPENEWLHISATYDGSGGVNFRLGLKLYVNGVQVDNVDFGSGGYVAMDASTANNVYIGRYATTYADGKFADVRIYDDELTASEVLDLYNGNNHTDNLIGHWLTNNDDVNDYAGTNDGTNNGSTYSLDNPSDKVEYGGASRSFDGVSDYIDLGNVLDDVFAGTGKQWTVSAWVKADTLNDRLLFAKWHNSSADRAYFARITSSGDLAVNLSSDGTTANRWGKRTDTSPISTNIWHHIAVSYDQTSTGDYLRLWVDGVEDTTPTDYLHSGTFTSIYSGSASIQISGINGTNSQDFDGSIADVRIYNTDLSSTEVYDLYKGVDHRTNLIGQWLTNSDDVEDKAGTNDGTNYGSTYSTDSPL